MARARKGSRVIAAVELTEFGFARRGREHVHAHPGDAGRVLMCRRGGLVLVRWERSGTACDCHVSELA